MPAGDSGCQLATAEAIAAASATHNVAASLFDAEGRACGFAGRDGTVSVGYRSAD